MFRRRFISGVCTTVPFLAVGCLDLDEGIDAVVDPGNHDGTPSTYTDIPSVEDLRDEADELAYVTLTIDRCHDEPALPTDPLPSRSDDDPPPVTAGLITNIEAATTTLEHLSHCTVLSSSHPPYVADPGAFIEETNLDFAYLVIIESASPVSIEFIGTISGNRSFIEISLGDDEVPTTTMARVGSFIEPAGLTIAAGLGDGTKAVFELEESP